MKPNKKRKAPRKKGANKAVTGSKKATKKATKASVLARARKKSHHAAKLAMAARKKKYLEALAYKPMNLSAAARAIGVNSTLPFRWRAADPDFAQAIKDLQESVIDKVQDALIDAATVPDKWGRIDVKAAMAVLSAHRPERYGQKPDTVSHTLAEIQVVEILVKNREEARLMTAQQFINAADRGQKLLEAQ